MPVLAEPFDVGSQDAGRRIAATWEAFRDADVDVDLIL
jgi:hypothetical protein